MGITTDANLTVANTIRDQIGHRAMVMLGASEFVGSENSLKFRVGKNGAKVTHIIVTLDADDTYTVETWRIARRGLVCDRLSSDAMVYVDSLHRILEQRTGMYTSL